jgi:hypothetical protein
MLNNHLLAGNIGSTAIDSRQIANGILDLQGATGTTNVGHLQTQGY